MGERISQPGEVARGGPTPPPWIEMEPGAEAAARDAYLQAFDAIGESPVRRQGETIKDYANRIGAKVSIWDCARFDPEPAQRQLAALAGVEDLRRWLASEHPYTPELPGGLAADGSDDLLDPERSIKRVAMERGRDVALELLAAEAAKVGVVVTAAATRIAA